jgi:anti-anti-sigma regulatory factor
MTLDWKPPMQWMHAPTPSRRDRPRWIIAELDVDGTIDEHAAMCLRLAIEDAPAGASATVLVDLRELTAIDADGVELFVRHDATCRAHGVELGLLICGEARHDEIASAFDEAGLGDQLQFTIEPAPPPRAPRMPAPPQRGVSVAWLRSLSPATAPRRGRAIARR